MPMLRILEGVELRAREAPDGGDRVIEGRIVPFGRPTMVRDIDAATGRHVGRAYREVITGLATDVAGGFDPTQVVLTAFTHARGAGIAGRGIDGAVVSDGADMAFRMLPTQAGNDLYVLAREGLITDLSIEMDDRSPTRRRPDGTVERTAIVNRVAAVNKGAYAGAQITAVRADGEGDDMPEDNQAAATAATAAAAAIPADSPALGATAAIPAGGELAARQAAERDAVATMGRSSTPIRVTRGELVYGPTSGRSFLRDLVQAREGNSEAAESLGRHYRMLEDVAGQVVAAREGFGALDRIAGQVILGRAGDVLSSEIPGAYPNTYLPGLLTPRVLKGRPMGGFYERVPISDARPQIFAKVSTSTTVAVQSAENVNPAASDFATTAVTATPLLYGAETVLSRQVIDGASPAAEQMVLADMLEAYAQASETVIKTAVEAGSTASGVAVTAATPFAGVQANVINYFGTRFQGAGAAFAPTAGFTTLLAENDTTGRPKLPWVGAVNSDGVVSDGGASGAMLGAAVKLSYASTVNVWVFARPSDFVIFESPIARFTYEASTGPSGVRIGIWAYLVVGARLGSLKVTAA